MEAKEIYLATIQMLKDNWQDLDGYQTTLETLEYIVEVGIFE